MGTPVCLGTLRLVWCSPFVGVYIVGVPTVAVVLVRLRCRPLVVEVVAASVSLAWLWWCLGSWVLAFLLVCRRAAPVARAVWAALRWLWCGRWARSQGGQLWSLLRARVPYIGTCPDLPQGGLRCSIPWALFGSRIGAPRDGILAGEVSAGVRGVPRGW